MKHTYEFEFREDFELVRGALALANRPFDSYYGNLTIETDEDIYVESILDVHDIAAVEMNVCDDDEHDQFRHDGEADGDALSSAGFGTDEDYGDYGQDEY